MTGRTPCTITTDAPASKKPSLPSHYFPEPHQQLSLLESAYAFSFTEQSITNIYTKESVSMWKLHTLATDLRDATGRIPDEFRSLTPSGPESHQRILGNASVACNYYFSMMILTRPFLITSIGAKYGRESLNLSDRVEDCLPQGLKASGEILEGALASIDSAIYTVRTLHQLLTAKMLFNNMPLVV